MLLYRERLTPSPWFAVATALVIPASILVFFPVNLGVGIATGVALYGAVLALAWLASPSIEIDADRLRLGNASIEREHLGRIRAFTGFEARMQRGSQLNARAFHLFRPSIDPVVAVENVDPEDPAPYWVFSTRRPQAVLEALTKRG